MNHGLPFVHRCDQSVQRFKLEFLGLEAVGDNRKLNVRSVRFSERDSERVPIQILIPEVLVNRGESVTEVGGLDCEQVTALELVAGAVVFQVLRGDEDEHRIL